MKYCAAFSLFVLHKVSWPTVAAFFFFIIVVVNWILSHVLKEMCLSFTNHEASDAQTDNSCYYCFAA